MTSLQRLCAWTCAFVAIGCSQPTGPQKAGPEAKTETKTEAEAAEPAKPAEAKAAAPTTFGKVRSDVSLPLPALLGQPVASVEANFGEHQGKGLSRSTCVRFAPERTFFRCAFALQRYADKGDQWAGIRVEYEDGVAASIGFDGFKKGSGPFDPKVLLAAVGLELPDEPRTDAPAQGVRRWAWFNDRARLKIGEHQYRVEISVVGEDWSRSRIDVILNDPLTPEQKAKIVPPGPGKAEVSEPPPGQ
ncbi:hypothetical protein SAMN02745121_03075 [Nannocystis exedens]|uniref:Lipoprotein n=1 Tax=Nannocystis exedens TaxID=54 RepID=A0A1I1Y3R9_9BACT|nr:hypothetical protein [Nannocystis exedens]PCC71723.1 hypothetical protein NAEX_04801 [Nannocystis exedens]SFE12733.1 hypothetical protein SAMN02745121_03075 [Nannocystis exedens]